MCYNKEKGVFMSKAYKQILSSFMIMVLLGIIYSYSVFRVEMEEELSISTVISGYPYMIKLLVFSLSMAFSGYLFSYVSSRKIAIMGSMFISVGFFISFLSQYMLLSNQIILITLGYGFLVGIGIGMIYGLPLRVLSNELEYKVGFWTGISLFGLGISPMIFSPMIKSLLVYINIYQLFLLLSILYATLLPLLTIYLTKFDRQRKIRTHSKISFSVLKQPQFYILYSLFFIVMFIGLKFIGLANNIGENMLGIEGAVIAILIGFFSFFNGLGRPVSGLLIDRIKVYKTSMLSLTSILIVLLLLYIYPESTLIFILGFSVVYFNFGSWLSIAPISTRQLFGLEEYSQNYGLLFTAYGLAAFSGTYFASHLFETFGYEFIYLLGILLTIVGILLLVLFKRQLNSFKKNEV
jgi:OFA family oxalate/formate antiporter-like MFS transporter